MATTEQIETVKAYLREHFASMEERATEHGARVRVTKGEAWFDLQVNESVFSGIAGLRTWLDSHEIAHQMRVCGPKSMLTLSGIDGKSDCTEDWLVKSIETALCDRIEASIHGAFPGAVIAKKRDEDKYIFDIGDGRAVEITRTFWFEESVEAALQRVEQWSPHKRIAELQPGQGVVIDHDGIRGR